jgi:hypothetical protein
MVGDEAVDKFVNDNDFAKGTRLCQQVRAEADSAGGGPGGPLPGHALNLDTLGLDVKLLGPLLHFSVKGSSL